MCPVYSNYNSVYKLKIWTMQMQITFVLNDKIDVLSCMQLEW